MEIDAHIEALRRAGDALLAVAAETPWSAEVPSCPGWRLEDLVRHLGNVHRWAERIVRERLAERVPLPEADPSGAALAGWFSEGLDALEATLRAADDDLDCFVFLPGATGARAFWARRQAHETTVHLMDAQLAAKRALSGVPVALALDGIDELLTGFHARPRSRVRAPEPRVLAVQGDEGGRWTTRLSEEPPSTVREAATRFDCRISGPAAALYATLWNRADHREAPVRWEGDARVMELWRARATV
ncbi:maleylpyruvate isomerase family mycothiol-dependent enzyme [Streptomyces sedi]|uniref:Maleylpyruvate isomerase family mycothiol-dependent enzyme n=1 Tax=Streptomyces sedi TaxID=555059 RepID=A0A5C4UWW7_9ACTN|nr:maleylpyruvate isomerase family mycothiol-dependent enzyme [Streptomyces sedi]TNM28184.1 maleylpyruvate isomerase family mycothiol-dependent enzyme [Streptomyces sedi]